MSTKVERCRVGIVASPSSAAAPHQLAGASWRLPRALLLRAQPAQPPPSASVPPPTRPLRLILPARVPSFPPPPAPPRVRAAQVSSRPLRAASVGRRRSVPARWPPRARPQATPPGETHARRTPPGCHQGPIVLARACRRLEAHDVVALHRTLHDPADDLAARVEPAAVPLALRAPPIRIQGPWGAERSLGELAEDGHQNQRHPAAASGSRGSCLRGWRCRAAGEIAVLRRQPTTSSAFVICSTTRSSPGGGSERRRSSARQRHSIGRPRPRASDAVHRRVKAACRFARATTYRRRSTRARKRQAAECRRRRSHCQQCHRRRRVAVNVASRRRRGDGVVLGRAVDSAVAPNASCGSCIAACLSASLRKF